jgi:hypothetical protein
VTVYCDAESHELWEHTYTRDEDGVWVPDIFDQLGDQQGKVRRDGGMLFLDAAGGPYRAWDSGRSLADAADRIETESRRAYAAAGIGTDEFLKLDRTYRLRCRGCGDPLKRAEDTLNKQFDWLVSQGYSRVTLPFLRALDRVIDELPGR